MSGPEGNGHLPDPDDDDADDDAPLDAAEAAQGAAAADEVSDETLDECVETVIEELEGVTRERDGEAVAYAVGGRVFAVLMPDLLEVALDPAVSTAALRTPDTLTSSRGRGWLAFTPDGIDRYALDRAEAWVRLAPPRGGRLSRPRRVDRGAVCVPGLPGRTPAPDRPSWPGAARPGSLRCVARMPISRSVRAGVMQPLRMPPQE